MHQEEQQAESRQHARSRAAATSPKETSLAAAQHPPAAHPAGDVCPAHEVPPGITYREVPSWPSRASTTVKDLLDATSRVLQEQNGASIIHFPLNSLDLESCAETDISTLSWWIVLLFSAPVRPLQCRVQFLGPQHKKDMASPASSHEDALRAGVSLLWGQAGRVGGVQPEEKLKRDLRAPSST